MIHSRAQRSYRENLIDYECWTITNLMKSNKGKYQILHVGYCNSGYTYGSEAERLECSHSERDLRVLVDCKL